MRARNEQLIAARKKSGKTQVQVAKSIGIDDTLYQKWEYGMNKRTIQTAIRIAREVGTTVESIWGGNPIPKV